MKNYKLVTSILGFVLAVKVAGTAADAPPLTFKFTRANVPGAIETSPSGINNAGAIVGEYEDKNKVWHGYILRGKKLTTLDHPKGTNTYCFHLPLMARLRSSAGTLIPVATQRAFYIRTVTLRTFQGPTGATSSVAWGINDSGAIVAWYADSAGIYHGFLLKGKKYTSKGYNKASLHDGKTYKTINVPGASETIVEGINNEGDVIYQWIDSSGTSHCALLHAGKYYKFDYPKAVDTWGAGSTTRIPS